MGMNTIEELKERVILIGVSTSDGDDTEESLKELKELADTAGAETVGTVIQNREAVHPGTYIGKGKIEEVRAMAFGLNATGVICDDELSPAQLNNLEQELDLKVMDRTLIILDIFAAHARTSEGKIQVELAQLKYRQARLVGLRNSLSRLGGGIGTRGPGEKKLEMDRRLIKSRIAQLNREMGTTVLLVEHEIELLAQYATRILVVHDGAILLDGTPQEVFSRRDIFDGIGLEVPQVTQIAACAGEEYGLWTGEPLPITMEQLCRRIRGDESGNED